MRNCQLKIAENKIYFTITNRSFYKNKVIESLIGTIVWAKKMNIWKEKEFKGKFLHRDDYWQKSSVRICNNFDFVNFNSAFISAELGLCFFCRKKRHATQFSHPLLFFLTNMKAIQISIVPQQSASKVLFSGKREFHRFKILPVERKLH